MILGVGSNLGDRDANIFHGLGLLAFTDGVSGLRETQRIETEPVGGPPQGRYMNSVVEIRTRISPRALLEKLHEIEAAVGRVRGERFGPRELDLDILLYGDLIVREPDLEIPHPRMLERTFVLGPLRELAPKRVHPVTGRTISDHWRELTRSIPGFRPPSKGGA